MFDKVKFGIKLKVSKNKKMDKNERPPSWIKSVNNNSYPLEMKEEYQEVLNVLVKYGNKWEMTVSNFAKEFFIPTLHLFSSPDLDLNVRSKEERLSKVLEHYLRGGIKNFTHCLLDERYEIYLPAIFYLEEGETLEQDKVMVRHKVKKELLEENIGNLTTHIKNITKDKLGF